MSKLFPRLDIDAENLVVKLDAYVGQLRVVPIKAVLDFDRFYNVIGVEIINLVLQVGENSLAAFSQSLSGGYNEMKYSYDAECDCFYLRLRTDKSVDQKSADATLCLDESGRIVEMNVNLPK